MYSRVYATGHIKDPCHSSKRDGDSLPVVGFLLVLFIKKSSSPDWISYRPTIVCSHPEDGLRCRLAVIVPLKLKNSKVLYSASLPYTTRWKHIIIGGGGGRDSWFQQCAGKFFLHSRWDVMGGGGDAPIQIIGGGGGAVGGTYLMWNWYSPVYIHFIWKGKSSRVCALGHITDPVLRSCATYREE